MPCSNNNVFYRWNETLPTPEYTAENAFEALREKVHLQWRDIAKVSKCIQAFTIFAVRYKIYELKK